MACDGAPVAIFLAAEITQVIDSIPWVRCASGYTISTSSYTSRGRGVVVVAEMAGEDRVGTNKDLQLVGS